MVYGCAFCPKTRIEDLEDLKVADSKVLTEQQREDILGRILRADDFVGWKVKILSPNYLSNSMLQKNKYNLNEISHDTAVELIDGALTAGVRVQEVYVDTVGDAGKYEAKLKRIFPQLSVTVRPKADSLYPVVSAASICAKVVRDRIIHKWQFLEKDEGLYTELGSGYPSDPSTRAWLEDNVDPIFGFPTLVRFSWSTSQKILDKRAVSVKWEDDEEDENLKKKTKGMTKLKVLFEPKEQLDSKQALQPHRFFKERGLTSVQKL
jgi:ribonuclease H2 subunit A